MSSSLFRALITLSIVTTVHAAPLTFFGEDLNGNPGARIPFPNAIAARTTFLSQVPGSGTDTLEEFSNSAPLPLSLGFAGVDSATVIGSSGFIESLASGTDGFGRFPTSGNNFLASDAASLTLAFASPVTAFGFYGTDIGDFGGQLSLLFTFAAGGTSTVAVPHSLGTGARSPQDGSVLFFGYINTANPFSSIQFLDSTASDTFGFDDPVIGRSGISSIPEPISAILVVTGLLILGLTGEFKRRETIKGSA